MKFSGCALGTVSLLLVLLMTGPEISEAKPSPRNGVIREYYASRRIRLEFRYKNGQLIRKRFWHKNGRLMSDYLYRDGKPVKKRDFYDNGRLKSLWTKKSGVLKIFDEDGSIRASIPNRVDGLF